MREVHAGILVATWILSAGTVAFADTLNQQQSALFVIVQTANAICVTAPLAQSNKELSGGAKATLAGAIGKIANIGIGGAAQYNSSQGVLQKDLAAAIKEGNECKKSVLKTLAAKMLSPASAAHSPASTPIPSRIGQQRATPWSKYSEFHYARPGMVNPGYFVRLNAITWVETGVDLRQARMWVEDQRGKTPGRLRLKDGPAVIEISPADNMIYYTDPGYPGHPVPQPLDRITKIIKR